MESRLALTLALIQLSLFALCWLLVVLLLRDQRRPALLFLGTCLTDALAATLQVTHQGDMNSVAAPLMTLGLASAAGVSAGADAFVHGRVRRGYGWWPILAVGVCGIWAPWPPAWGALGPLAAYQVGFLLMLLLPVWWLQRPLRQEFGRHGWLPLLPFALLGLAVAAFLVHLALDPAAVARSYAAREDRGASSLIPFVITSGLFHICWLGMMLGRQVVKAQRLARTDGLTGALRRGPFEAELASALSLARRLAQPVTLAFVDVDHFKRINDQGGHQAGDEVLQALGATLRRTLRQSDRCARWGGEEFVLLLPGLDTSQAPLALQRVVGQIQRASIAVPAGCPPLTVSVGYVTWAPAGETDAARLIAQADAAMYEAKRRGRNTLVRYSPSCDAPEAPARPELMPS